MLNITHSSIFVLDQDEALDFYVGKLGFEVSADVDMGFMRWLTVSAPGDPDREILLEQPGPPAHDDATAEQVRELVTKGAAGVRARPAHRRLPQDLRGAQGQGRRVHRRADRALLRHRLRAARPVRQQHPHRAARAGAARPPRPRGVRPELTGDGRRSPPARHLLRARKDLADRRYAEPLDVPALARAARLSPAHFSREFRARVRRDAAPLPADAPPGARGGAAAHDRSLGGRHLHDRRAAQRRLVHDELRADVRAVADGLPRDPPAGVRARAGPDLRPARVGPPATARPRA